MNVTTHKRPFHSFLLPAEREREDEVRSLPLKARPRIADWASSSTGDRQKRRTFLPRQIRPPTKGRSLRERSKVKTQFCVCPVSTLLSLSLSSLMQCASLKGTISYILAGFGRISPPPSSPSWLRVAVLLLFSAASAAASLLCVWKRVLSLFLKTSFVYKLTAEGCHWQL